MCRLKPVTYFVEHRKHFALICFRNKLEQPAVVNRDKEHCSIGEIEEDARQLR